MDTESYKNQPRMNRWEIFKSETLKYFHGTILLVIVLAMSFFIFHALSKGLNTVRPSLALELHGDDTEDSDLDLLVDLTAEMILITSFNAPASLHGTPERCDDNEQHTTTPSLCPNLP